MLINSWEYEWVIKIVSGSKTIVSGSARSWIQDTRDWKVASRILWLEVHSNQTRLRQLLWFLHPWWRLLRQNIQRQQQELLWLWFQARISTLFSWYFFRHFNFTFYSLLSKFFNALLHEFTNIYGLVLVVWIIKFLFQRQWRSDARGTRRIQFSTF